MTLSLTENFIISAEVAEARRRGTPIVALESTVITHGLPHPKNLTLAQNLETEIRSAGVVPATIAILEGKFHIGLTLEELTRLANLPNPMKISRRDISFALVKNESGGTTVAGTLIAANTVRMRVFATGGIGGVHRNAPFDVSADLLELSRTPLIVVCTGAKAILDLPATLEYLETMGVPVVGYQTDEFPAFYSVHSGLPVNIQVTTPEEIVEIARKQWELGLPGAILVVNPPPGEAALPGEKVNRFIEQAVGEAELQGIRGAQVTPFLLNRVSELTGGESLRANLALLKSNARLAAQIAKVLAETEKKHQVIL